ncbi:MAG TPA: efflux RND transporter periplasmic adaptor subunit [Gemmatimonadales bacterium]
MSLRLCYVRWPASMAAVSMVAAVVGCSGPNPDEETALGGGGAVTRWTDSTELFMEYPPLIVGRPETFAVHLTDLTDFAPLRSGRVTFRFQPGGGGEPVVLTANEPRSPGIYGPAPAFTRPGSYDLTIEIESPQVRDVVHITGLEVHAGVGDTPAPATDAGDGITFLKEQQWRTPGFRTAFATRGDVAASFDASGEIRAAAGRLAEVAAPIDGFVDASGVRPSPAPGGRVRRGDVLAAITPALGDAGGAYAEARRALRDARAEYERAARLYEVGAVSRRRLDEAQSRLQAAGEALAGLGGDTGDLVEGKLAIRAPIAGVVTERRIVPGSRVAAGAPLFTIVDASVVWLEVHVPAALAPRVLRTSGATFWLEGGTREYRTSRVISVGAVIDQASRTVPVLYEVGNRDGAIKVGATARAAVQTGERVSGVVILSSAVLDEDGRPIAYVQVEGERFEKRSLTVGGSEGGRTVVLSGISEGERVVTGAAYQVRLASLSTAVPEHGHEH